MNRARLLLPCLALIVLAPLPAESQTFEFTPIVGMYTPMGFLVNGVDRTDNSPLRRRQLVSLLTGARLQLRPSSMFGLEMTGSISPSQVAVTNRTSTQDVSGVVAMASVRAVFKVSGQIASGQWSFHVEPGVGMVRRYGNAWRGTGPTTDPAFVVAGGWRLGRLTSLRAFRFDVEDYITRFDYTAPNAEARPMLHHDFVWSFGYSIPVTDN